MSQSKNRATFTSVFAVLLVCSSITILSCATTENRHWVPTQELIEEIEQTLVFPENADEPTEYYRLYNGYYNGREEVVEGTFLSVDGHRRVLEERGFNPDGDRVIIISDPKRLISIMDGGCSVISLHWMVKTREILSFHCNGHA